MRFEWDEAKNRRNKIKHGVSFEQATGVFAGDYLQIPDDAHSDVEERFIVIGPAADIGVLFVVATEREGDVIRIIGARRAARGEIEKYRRFKDGET